MSSNNSYASNLTDILTRVATTTTTTLPGLNEKMTILKALIGQNRTIMQLRQRILSRLLFPDFYNDEGANAGAGGGSVDSAASLDYKLGQEYEETSRFLDSLSGSGSPNKTVLFTSDDYSASSSFSDYESGLASQMLNETSSDYDGGYLSQMSTPFMYILFMFVVYIIIITVIFMSAVYSHRKRVGYNYDGDEEELIGESEHIKSQPSSVHEESEQRAGDDDDSDSDFAPLSNQSRCKRNQESNNLAYSGDSSSSDESSDIDKAAYVKTNRAKNISYLENMFKLLADVNIDDLKRSIRSNKILNRKTRNSRAIVKESDKSLDVDDDDEQDKDELESKDKIVQSSCASVVDTSEPLLKKRDDDDHGQAF